MADPITIALIASAAASTVGAIQQGNAAESQAESEANIAKFNQDVALQQANEEEAAAAERALIQEKEGEKFKGKQRAAAGVTGVETRGSILSVLEDTATTLELDRLNIVREGAIRAGQRRSQATGFGLEAKAAKSRAKSQSRATVLTAVGSGLSGAASIGSSRSSRGLNAFSPGKAK